VSVAAAAAAAAAESAAAVAASAAAIESAFAAAAIESAFAFSASALLPPQDANNATPTVRIANVTFFMIVCFYFLLFQRDKVKKKQKHTSKIKKNVNCLTGVHYRRFFYAKSSF
jgi:hypothetical protein